jgi:Zn-dependent protease/predicted transcriptional regulator
MGGEGYRIGRIGGIEIRADASVLFISIWIVVSRWSEYSTLPFPYRPSSTGLALLAIASALVFFGSLLLHEFGHAVVARARHIPVDGITLWMFGGATRTRSDAKGPVDEFLISAVGPATNLVLGVALEAFARTMPLGATRLLVHEMGWINLLLAAFNILPGFPMDGGRVLRSIVWAVSKDRSIATIVAARVGQVFGIGVIAYGILQLTRGGVQNFGSIWFALIGVILFQAATATVAQERRTRALSKITASDAMRTPPASLSPETPVGTVRDAVLAGRDGAFPVMAGPNLLGFVSRSMLQDMSADRPVGEAAAGSDAAAVVPASMPLGDVIARMQATTGGIALVVEGDRLVGVIGQEDVAAALNRRPAKAARAAS